MTVNAHPTSDLSLAELAASAAACLLISEAHLYGLIDSDAGIDRAKCIEIVQRARRAGIVPEQEEIEAKAIAVMCSLGVVRE